MKLESLGGKPLDYIKDESGENRGLYQDGSGDNEEELTSADDFVGVLDAELDELYRDSGLEEYSGRDIGEFSIGAPTVDKKEQKNRLKKKSNLLLNN